MAFENLTEKFKRIFKTIKGESKLTESNMDSMLKEIRVALLEADVNYKVVKTFLDRIKEKAIGQKVFTELNPSEMLVKIVNEELIVLLGSDSSELHYNKSKPTIIMLVGLQGSGKTTTAGKLAKLMKDKLKKKVLLAACDIYRPGAIDQLGQIAKKINVPLFSMGDKVDPVEIATKAKEEAYNSHYDVLIIDTAGRLQIDEKLMDELKNIKSKVNPDEILLLTDAMAGQDSVNVAKTFNELLGLTGTIMSKLDGDSRGGAALSIKEVTGVPIKFIGVGEKLDDLDIFYPDRMASRILGMGDVLTLVEKVQDNIDEKQAKKSVEKFTSGNFTLIDMLDQMKQIKKLGSLGGLLKLIPGMPKISKEQQEMAEKEMQNFEIILNSMTYEEKIHPEIIKNSRKVRIAKGCGKTAADINKVLKKYEQSKEMMKQMNRYKKSGGLPPNFRGF
ncbi:MAG: signal recognition particle protein [Mollicutes bacterium]|nr:signal recognition particle protein [Mollicutes bacterium]MDD7263389.1 signal recognition particle protein [bacterium]MDY4979053.1 signal recognition particle protein [Candidatus Onthovivens sp.]